MIEMNQVLLGSLCFNLQLGLNFWKEEAERIVQKTATNGRIKRDIDQMISSSSGKYD